MGQSVEVVVSELQSAAARLEDAAQRLKDGLSTVDDQTTQLLGSDWKGEAATAYGPAWDKWHGGAEQVVTGLQRMSELLTIAGKEYAKTDESASEALGSTVQGAGGSPAVGGGGGASGGQSASQGASGAGGAEGAGVEGAGAEAAGTEGAGASPSGQPQGGAQQAMSSASQLGQLAAQPLSQVGQAATGIAQAIAGLAQQATELAASAAQQAEDTPSADVDEDDRADGEPAAPGERSAGAAPVNNAPASEPPRAVERPGD